MLLTITLTCQYINSSTTELKSNIFGKAHGVWLYWLHVDIRQQLV